MAFSFFAKMRKISLFIIFLITFYVNGFKWLHHARRNVQKQFPIDSIQSNTKLNLQRPPSNKIFHIEQSIESTLPRLSEDLQSLLTWVTNENGFILARVNKTNEGWTLVSSKEAQPGQCLVSIPKKLCIFSNPERNGAVEMPLLNSTLKLMASLDESQWRVRLAVAMLSERVRPNSSYRSYLRNLPFEYWGLPMFFNSSVFNMIQDLSIMQRTRDRCRFLLEFTENVLIPLHKTTLDPFLSQSADVNAFGWAFAAAASRALRNPSAIKSTGHVMVPVIDIASHSFVPNCEVVDVGDAFELRAMHHIPAGFELTINYGPLSNDELFSDYGFSVDSNKYDCIQLNCDTTVLNTARSVMGQCGSLSPGTSSTDKPNPKAVQVGRGGDKVDELSLHKWQLVWMQAIGMLGYGATPAVFIGGPDPSRVDPRLWAFLRLLYAGSEEELLAHGYDPVVLQSHGSLLTEDKERHVIRTLVGIVAIVLRLYSTEDSYDMEVLRTGSVNFDVEARTSAATDDIAADAYRIIRNALGYPATVPVVLPMVTTLRRMYTMPEESVKEAEEPISSEDELLSLEALIRREVSVIQAESKGLGVGVGPGGGLREDLDQIRAKAAVNADADVAFVQDIRDSRSGLVDLLATGPLPVSIREVVKFRLRKKWMLEALICNLSNIYKQLHPRDQDGILPPVPSSSGDGRRARIRELLNEVRTKTGTGLGAKDESELLAAASKWSSKWSDKGLSL